MGWFQDVGCYKGSLCWQLILFFIWLLTLQDVTAQETHVDPRKTSSLVELVKEPISGESGLFDPIEISPAVLPKYSYPVEPLPPMYPTFPTRYEPVLSDAVAGHCFSDIMSILASRQANSTLPTLCSIKSSNFTGGSCPVKDVSTFEKTVNTSKLLEACSTIDQLKECCRPICQPAIMDAALQISGRQMMFSGNENVAGEVNHTDYLNDCKGVVYSYISRKLSLEAADTAFRILSACKVNKVCPLTFKEPSEVIRVCRNVADPSCCNSLHTYIAWLQKQMLITNKQAILCATLFGSMLRKGGVLTNVYELCDIDLKDFSLPAYGLPEGCLLRSLPANVIADNSSGISFTCDLSDNVAAPWPSSSSITSLSLCAPEMSLPALPTWQTLKNIGCNSSGVGFLVLIFSFFFVSTLLYF